MNAILNNPYRIVGLLVGTTAAEQRRQLTRLQRFLEADQEPEDDFSFPSLGYIQRTLESVNEAASKLNLDSDKMSSALFWFYKGNPITDEPAFDALKEADIDQVINIWTKLTSNGEITQRNASAYNNLGTLYLSGILKGSNTNEAIWEQGISLKLKFLESDFIKDFKALATDETFKTTKKELQLLFLNQYVSEVEKSRKVTSSKFLDIITKQEFSAKEEFLKGFVQKPIEQIEKKVEEAKTKRKANKANAINIGKSLFEQTSENLKQLKSILGTSNLKFSSISDKVSDEILQCGIDYFNFYLNITYDKNAKYSGFHDENFAITSIMLIVKAKSYAYGIIVRQRCQESTEAIQEYIDKKVKFKNIEREIEELKNIFEEYSDKEENIKNAEYLIQYCKPRLYNIKDSIGIEDEFYLNLSTRVASQAQSFIISEVNSAYDHIEDKLSRDRSGTINNLKGILSYAWYVTTLIGTITMDYNYKTTRYNINTKSLKELCEQIGVKPLSLKSHLELELLRAHGELDELKKWQFLRSESEKQRQILEQNNKIDNIKKLYYEVSV